jgi:glycosyltransferase involved in cell wall biosynthesis
MVPDGCLQQSTVFMNSILSIAPGTLIPAARVEELINSGSTKNCQVVVTASPWKGGESLAGLEGKYGGLRLVLPDEDGGQLDLNPLIGEWIADSSHEFTMVVDGRYDVPQTLVRLMVQLLRDSADADLALVDSAGWLEDIKGGDTLADRMGLLATPLYPKVAVFRNSALARYDQIIRSDLRAFALSELVIRLALESGTVLVPEPESLKKDIRQAKFYRDNEQLIMDEENSVLEQYQRDFFFRKLGRLDPESFSASYVLHARAAMQFFEKLQQGQGAFDERHERHVFGYCLLALYAGEVESARMMMETVFGLVSERPVLMRLYKQLVLNFPLEREKLTDDPKVSVVIPLFNQGHYLEEALVSVVNQTYANWEVCIINDGSTDDSLEVARKLVQKIDDPRIRLLSQENRGKGGTRNRGIRETDGKYIVTLDSDDMIAPDYFSVAVELMEKNPRAAWVTPKTLVFGKDNHVAWKDPFEFAQSIIKSPSPSSSILRRTAIEEAGLYREDLTNREDAEIWLTLIENGWISITTDVPLFVYRHACNRPGLRNISNIPSKEEITSLHPWWYRRDLDQKFREKAYTEVSIVRYPRWFIHWENIKRVLPHVGDREKFLEVMAEIKSEYPPVTKPCRWKNDDDDCYLQAREVLYGVRSRKADG